MQKNNRLILLAAFLFFLLTQWFSVYFRLYAHPGPYGLDDAASYIQQINYFRELPFSNPFSSATPITKALHPYIFGALASLIGLSAEAMFHVSFYIGLFLMGLVLLAILHRINSSVIFIALGMGILAFHSGTGNYHGFGWVVPSFYAIMLFLLAIIATYYSRHPILYGAPLVALLLMTHSTGLYLSVLLLASLMINSIVFQRSRRWLVVALVFLGAGAAMLLISQHLHDHGVLGTSFYGPLHSYGKGSLIGDVDGGEFWRQYALMGFKDVQYNISRYHFVKYMYGMFTPLVIFGAYRAYRDKKTPLLSLFFSALVAQIVIPLFARYGARFFYPLEILTWILIVYGTAYLIHSLWFAGSEVQPRQVWQRIGHWGLLGLFMIFVYNTVHDKVYYDYKNKFEALRLVNETELLSYLNTHKDKRIGVFALIPNTYHSLEGAYTFRPFTFNPSAEQIIGNTSDWVILADNHQYFEQRQRGIKAVLPAGGELVLESPFTEAGKYRIELSDNGTNGISALTVALGETGYAGWKEDTIDVAFPETGAFPPITLPWYLHESQPWPLYKKPNHIIQPVRTSKHYSMTLQTKGNIKHLVLHNEGPTIHLTGQIRLTNVATGKTKVWDLYRGSDRTLKEEMALHYQGNKIPLLWSNSKGAEGIRLLYRLEKNLGDVKALVLYAKSLEEVKEKSNAGKIR